MIPAGRFRGSMAAVFAPDLVKDSSVTHISDVQHGPAVTARASAAELVIARYKEGRTHAVSLLHQLAQILQFHLEMKETVTTGNILGFYFAFCVVIDGVVYKTGMGNTKKDARLNAAELALQDLLPSLENIKSSLPESPGVPSPLPIKEDVSPSDMHPVRSIRDRKNFVNHELIYAVRNQLTELLSSHQEFSACAATVAAFIIQTSRGCEVVALGTGDYNIKQSSSSSGRLLHDCNAVVTARRSLMRFLYRHLLMFYSKTTNLTGKSIFCQKSGSGLLALKSDVVLHLYMNQLPKGAARMASMRRLAPSSMSAWQVSQEMSLHLSVEGKVFSVSSSVFEDSKLISMSNTDKIMQWQVLGYQGALLSHFIEPVYAQSILIGDSSCSDIRGVEIAINQRVGEITSHLPMFYCTTRPHMSLVPSVAPDNTLGGHVTHSVNWSEGDSSVEVVDSLEGKTIEESPFKSSPALASRLCKAAMLHRFRLVAKEAQRQELLATSSYREAKMMAKPYQEAKNLLRAHLLQGGFGSWRAKLSISDDFSM